MVLESVPSPQLNNQRDVLVYLPPSYTETDRRYPVIYMHDGQNLFDAATSYVGEWCVDETLGALSAEGIEAIVVGIPNMNLERAHELSPFVAPRSKGLGDAYLSFIVDTVKPLIDAEFRTDLSRTATGLMGSSMGGLITLYGFYKHRQVFGFAGVVSPALFFGNADIYPYVENATPPSGKIYMDVGTDEGRVMTEHLKENPDFSRRYLESVRRMNDLLIAKGFQPDVNYRYVEDEGATHNETEWARRLPDALRFLLS
jgi:predicted alpha/beta superfamily hydrolase